MRTLLIVDDEANALLGMGYYFRRAGYEAHCAREREEAEALLAHKRYDCAIFDLCITPEHGADGLDLIAFARGRAPETRIVVLIGHESPTAEAEVRSLSGPGDSNFESPDVLFEFVRRKNEEVRVDRACVAAALDAAAELAIDIGVAVNVHVLTLVRDPGFGAFVCDAAAQDWIPERHPTP